MRNQITGREVIIRRVRVSVSRGHHKRYVSRWKFIRRFCTVLLEPNGRFDRTSQCRVLHHLAELVDIILGVVTIFIPYI